MSNPLRAASLQNYLQPNKNSSLSSKQRWLSRHVLALHDLEALAKRQLPLPLFEYICGAAETNQAKTNNASSFNDFQLVPRVLRDTSQRHAGVRLFDHDFAIGFGIAPMGIAAMTHYQGDLHLAQAASIMNGVHVLSATSLLALEKVLDGSPHRWFQGYFNSDQQKILGLLKRVANTGCQTLIATIDLPVPGNRENNIRAGFSMPLRPSLSLAWQGITHPRWSAQTFMRTLLADGIPHFENSSAERGAPMFSSQAVRDFSKRDDFSWDQIAFIREHWQGKLVIKGILHPDDAAMAAKLGADGVILSNHGGRQLDYAVSPMQMLPLVVDALPDFPVMIDGGFERGTDVMKAYALGASFVFVGRPMNYALAVGGVDGVVHAMALLDAEIHRNLSMIGCNSLQELDESYLLK